MEAPSLEGLPAARLYRLSSARLCKLATAHHWRDSPRLISGDTHPRSFMGTPLSSSMEIRPFSWSVAILHSNRLWRDFPQLFMETHLFRLILQTPLSSSLEKLPSARLWKNSLQLVYVDFILQLVYRDSILFVYGVCLKFAYETFFNLSIVTSFSSSKETPSRFPSSSMETHFRSYLKRRISARLWRLIPSACIWKLLP